MLCLSKFCRYAVAGFAAACFLMSSVPIHAQPLTHRDYMLNGDSPSDGFGISVSGAGDVNNDGYADLIVGANSYARVLSGPDRSVLYTFVGDDLSDAFGIAVSGAGDVNNDGFADLIVGAPLDDNNGSDSGSARVFSGQDGSTLYTFDGDSQGDDFGRSVSGAGDVNNDGYADLIVGAPLDGNNGIGSGSARVLSGQDGSTLYTFDGDGPADNFGLSVSGVGDVNNDGYADLIVGADGDDNNGANSGSARVFSGQDGSVLYTFDGDSLEDQFGVSVSGAGDVNNDGFTDLIVGASGDDNNGASSGSARVFSGEDGSVLYTFDGDSPEDQFGGSVGAAGDVNNDGYADLIVGARILCGQDGSVLFPFSGGSGNFGQSVGAGDVNNDGVDDFIVGTFEGTDVSVFVSQASLVVGDVNRDGRANFLDIGIFIQVLCCGSFQDEADIDRSGSVDFLDVAPFVALLNGDFTCGL